MNQYVSMKTKLYFLTEKPCPTTNDWIIHYQGFVVLIDAVVYSDSSKISIQKLTLI